jgi:hypothetical protein
MYMQTKDLQRSVGDRYATKGLTRKIGPRRSFSAPFPDPDPSGCGTALNAHFLSFHPGGNPLASQISNFRVFRILKTAL